MTRLDLRPAPPFTAPRGLVFALALLVLPCAACRQLPHRQGSDVDVVVQGSGLEELNPIDVAVPPILDETGTRAVPLGDLRDGFQLALAKRRYSPLALDYVDRQVVDASYVPGAVSEQAVLQVTVRRWDTRLWATHGSLFVDVEARMIDPERPSTILWGGRLERRVESEDDPSTRAPRTLVRDVALAIAEEILAAMPARRATP